MKKKIQRNILKVFALTLVFAMLIQMTVYAEESGTGSTKTEAAESKTDDALHNLPTKWDLTQFYADEEAFNKAMDRCTELIKSFENYRGTLHDKEGILKYLQDKDIKELNEILNNANMYRTGLEALNSSDPLAQRVAARINDVDAKKRAASAFVDAEIMELPLEKRQEIFGDPDLASYAYSCRRFTDPDEVILDEKSQKIYDQMYDAASKYEGIHNVFDNVELPRPTVKLPDGKEEKLTDELFTRVTSSPDYDHALKEEVYEKRQKMRAAYKNTYAAMLEGEMKSFWASAQVEGFKSSLEYACHQTNVDPKIYDKIIESVHEMLPMVHEYYKIQKEKSGLDKYYIFDAYTSTNNYKTKELDYEDAVNIGRSGIRVWGDEYLSVFDKIITNPLIDVYPGETKTGGAFEELAGKKTLPMVMYNYDGLESYISTIVHEMGHAVYSEFSAENQDENNDLLTIFTQEVASTANECMFHTDKIKKAESDEEKKFWLESEINLFIGTIVRQCMYSEFEDYCYKQIEAGKPLSASEMDQKYLELQREYYGDAVTIPDYAGNDWARIPHFYYHYYVYQYATSMTYAAAICERVEKEGQTAIDDYISFLKAGGSASPADLLKIAGVDPMKDETYAGARAYFKNLLDQYK